MESKPPSVSARKPEYIAKSRTAILKVYICDDLQEHMPMWAPPTPPQDDNDVYIDQSMCFMYEASVMTESQLPPVYVKKEHKRIRIDPAIAAVARKHKVRREEHHRVPRSLFDRPQSLLRKERELKLMKLKQFAKPPKPQLLHPSRPLDIAESHPDWLIHEDWALLQALQMLQELPSTLSTDSPAIIPNWDLVADMVNTCSRTYRSIKHCKNRYENVIVPREEGKILYDINPRKQKKNKGIYKTKNNRPMRTSQLFLQDNNNAVTTLYTLRFDSVKGIAAKRTPTIRPTLGNPTLKNPKHAAVLAENGINYETPLTPTQVAANRAERIAKEKLKNQEAAQQLITQRTATTSVTTASITQPTVAVAVTTATSQPTLGTTTIQTVTGQHMTILPSQQIQTPVAGNATTVVVTQAGGLQKVTAPGNPTVAAVSLARTIGQPGSIVVNPASANAFAAINKRIAGQTIIGSVPHTASVTAASSIAQAVRTAARTATGQMTVQEIAAVVNQNTARLGAPNTAQVITTTTLTPAQLLAAQKAGTVTVSNISAAGTVPQGATKQVTAQQLQMLRLRQQQQSLRKLTVQAAQGGQTVAAVGQGLQKTVAVTTALISSITQSQVSQARLQLAKPTGLKGTTVTRSLTGDEMALLLRKQRAIVSQAAQPVHQVQMPQGHRLTTAQIITGTAVQQIQSSSASGINTQPVATLVKSQGGATVPSVTIPVTAVSLGISVNVPAQKTVAGKAQQMRQIQLQQIRKQQLQAATGQHKVATLQSLQQIPKGPGGTTPLLIPQQQQALPKVMVQQIQQIVKQQQQQPSQTATIQQIIASVSPAQTTTGTVIATQLMTQAQPTASQTVSKMSVPGMSVTSVVAQPARSVNPLTVTTVPVTGSQGVPLATASLVTPAVTIPNQALKNIQEVVISPQKSVSLQAAGVQQLRTVQQGVRQIQGASGISLAQLPVNSGQAIVQHLGQPGQTVAVTSTPKLIQGTSPVIQQLVQPNQTIQHLVSASPNVQPNVQQAVQKVVQEAQAQAQHRVTTASTLSVSGTTGSPLVAAQNPPVTQVSIASVPQAPVSPQVTTVTQPQGLQQIVTTIPGQSPVPGQEGGKNSPYTMRLRNQPR